MNLEPFNPNKLRAMTSKKDAVKYILIHKPQARGSDPYLTVMFYRYFHNLEFRIVKDEFGKIKDMSLPFPVLRNKKFVLKFYTSFETIRRTRQKLQELHPELRPTEKTLLKRQTRADYIRETINTEDWEL